MAEVHQRADTTWFRKAGWGVFHHFLASPASSAEAGTSVEEWNRRVDAFDVERLAGQLAEVGAGYYCITLGQNSGHYCVPNATYDALVGHAPSKLSRRDLVMDLSEALSRRDIHLMLYTTGGAPENDHQAVARLEWRRGNYRLATFQTHWNAIHREWSKRYGTRVSGWWIDGCYFNDAMYRHLEEPNFASFAGALRNGNPQAILAFNPGVITPVIRASEFDDYTAGELDRHLPVSIHTPEPPPILSPIGQAINGATYHQLGFLGHWWGQGPPRFPDDLVAGYSRYVLEQGGVMTWDVPVESDGGIPVDFMRQLRRVGQSRAT